MSFEKPAVVIDNGSYNIKAGFACDNHPVSIFRTVVGRPNYLHGSYGKQYYDVHIGDEAIAKIEDLELNCPVLDGNIVHWDNMERVWHHVFYKELKVAPEDRSIILACSSTVPMKDKIKCCELFFETLNAPAICIQLQSVLAIYGSGLTTGVAVDLGYDKTEISPVYEGGVIGYAVVRINVAARQISEYIEHSLQERRINLGKHHQQISENIIRDCLYVTQEYEKTFSCPQKKYVLPSGEEIKVSEEAHMGAEIMFEPDLMASKKSDVKSLQEAVTSAVLKCDSDLRTDLYDGIVPCGGISMVPGLVKRLSTEVERLVHRPVTMLTSSEASTVAWLGGATFAGMSDAKKMWVLKKQYEDHGARIVKNRFM